MRIRKHTQRGLTGLDLVFTLCGIALLVGAVIVMVSFTIPITQESLASSSWPTASGKIVESRVESKSRPGKKSTTKSIIKYLYMVDGVELLGERVKADESFENDFNIKSRYPRERSVQVHYNPERPWKSVLEPGFEFGLSFFFPLVMLVLGALFAFLPSYSERRKKKRLAEGAEIPKQAGKVMGGFLIAFGVISVVFALVMGVVASVALGGDAKKASDTTTWTAVEGNVLESGFVETQERGEKEKTWEGHIEYRYEQDGEAYTSSRYALGVGRDPKPEGEAVYGNRPGDTVTVYVDPANPASAVFATTPLKKSWGAYSIFMLIPTCMVSCGLVFAAVGLVTVLRA